MPRYNGTILPQSNDVNESQKAILDLLAKINATGDDIDTLKSLVASLSTSSTSLEQGKVAQLICRSSYTGNGILLKSGKVLTFGQNTGAGACSLFNGAPTTDSVYRVPFIMQDPPGEFGTLIKARMWAHGGAMLYSTGNLYVAGYNISGTLGLGDVTARPMLTFLSSGVVDFREPLCLSHEHNQYRFWVKKDDGYWWVAGYNVNGACGLGNVTNPISTLTKNTALGPNVRELWNLGCTYGVTFVQKIDGTLWACGANNTGQIGNNTTTLSNAFIDVSSFWGITSSDIVLSVLGGYGYYDSAANGSSTTVALISKDGVGGRLKCTGSNAVGQLGINSTTQSNVPVSPLNIGDDVVTLNVSGAPASVYALTANNVLYTYGHNANGQLGLGTTANTLIPTVVSIPGESISQIFASNNATTYGYRGTAYVQTASGRVYATGVNTNGQCGDGTFTQRTTFTPVPFNTLINGNLIDVAWNGYGDGQLYGLLLTDTGRCFAVGYNGRQGLTFTGDTTNRSVPTELLI